MTSQTSTIETAIPEGTVILRESEVQSLDEAVRRVREDATTRHARILIVDSDHPLDGEVQTATEGLPAPVAAPQLAPSTQGNAARRLGEQLACLERFLGEAGEVLAQADETPGAALASLQEIHQWSIAVVEEMGNELTRLQRGETRVSVRAALRAAAAQTGLDAGVADETYRVWARPTQLSELIGLAHWLVSARSNGAHVVSSVHRESGRRSIELRFAADADSHPVRDAGARIARLRQLVQELGGGLPAPTQPDRPELRVELPLAD